MDPANTLLTTEEIKDLFAVRRKRQLLLLIPVVLLFAFAFLVGTGKLPVPIDPSSTTPKIVLFLVVAACVGYSWVNWRCPACNGYLGRGIGPKHCRNCGAELR
jgi:hypothetical protein